MSPESRLASHRASISPRPEPLVRGAGAPPLVLPDDAANRELGRNVHPADWVNPTPAGRYNLVVIGAGTAGLVTAAGAAGLGARVALVERHLMGGDCLNYGCVPSKAVIRAAAAAQAVREAGRFGVSTGAVSVDFGAAMARMRQLRAGISRHDSAERFSKLGVDVFLGEARFTGRDTVAVGDQTLRFSRAVVASGARAFEPPIPGLGEVGFLTNETVFSLTAAPRRLAVVGAGPIGCELAQSFARLGSQVVVLSLDDRLIPREEPDASAVLAERFAAEGIDLRLSAELVAARAEGQGKRLVFRRQGREDSVLADEILVATGRAPNVEGLGLEEAGVDYSRKGIQVDDRLRTTNRRIYAAGDVCSRFQFTHAADAMARVVIQNALFFGRKKASALVIPWCTYTDPEIAHVGLSESEGQARFPGSRTFSVDLAGVDRAVLEGETEGFARVHVDRKGKILGATLVARHAGEMLGEIVLAMNAGLGLGAIASTILPYPTQAEVWKRVGDAYSRTRLTPGLKRLFERILKWRR